MSHAATTNCKLCGGTGHTLYQKVTDRLFGVLGQWRISTCDDRHCGLVWIDPPPAESSLQSFYHGYHTHHSIAAGKGRISGYFRHAEERLLEKRWGYPATADTSTLPGLSFLIGRHPGRSADLDAAVFNLPLKKDGKVLEVGFGNAHRLAQLDSFGWQAVGVDFDKKSVDNALKLGLDVRSGELANQNFADSEFDAVVSSHLLEHVADPVALLREMHRIVKPGGTVVAYTPNNASLLHRIFAEAWRGLEPPRHLQIFSPHSLRKLAQIDGLEWRELDVRPVPRAKSVFAESWRLYRGLPEGKRSRIIQCIGELIEFIEFGGQALGLPWGEELLLMAKKK